MPSLSRIFASALLLAAPAAFAQSTATAANVSATARIYVPISLAKSADLSFGDVFTGATSSTVTLDPQSSTRTVTGDATLASTGAFNAASFTVSGKRNATYAITLPADNTISLSGAGTAMPLSKFTASVNGTAATGTATGLLPNTAGASQTFTVGATLTLGANQTDGDYLGKFDVMVAYN